MSLHPAIMKACRETVLGRIRATGRDWTFRARLLAAPSGMTLVVYDIMARRFGPKENTR